MAKAVLNRDICFIEAALSWVEHRHYSLHFTSHGSICPPPSYMDKS